MNRLNGVVSGSPGPPAGSGQGPNSVDAPWRRRPIFHPPSNESRQATPAERRQQLAQLADMGVAVPEEFRRDMAMAGDWQVVSETPLYEPSVKNEEGEEEGSNEERKYSEALNIGVRKRKFNDREEGEDDEAGETEDRKVWGSTLHTYPQPNPRGEEDLDSLIGKTKLGHTTKDASPRDGFDPYSPPPHPDDNPQQNHPPTNLPIKQEDTDETQSLLPMHRSSGNNLNHIKDDPDGPGQQQRPQQAEVVFKKRKPKPIRNK